MRHSDSYRLNLVLRCLSVNRTASSVLDTSYAFEDESDLENQLRRG